MTGARLALLLLVAVPLSCHETVRPTEVAAADAAPGAMAAMPPDTAPGHGVEPGAAPIRPMPLISRGLPSFASHEAYPAKAAFDADYATEWRSAHVPTTSDPDWVAIDLTTVPPAARASVYSLWFNEAGYDYDTADGASYALPGDYEIQSHAATGDRQAPTSGWVTIVQRPGNTLSSGANLLHLGDAGWLRLVCTANPRNTAAQNHDVALQWALYDARAGVDAWKFVGDSITANAMTHAATNDAFDQLVARQVPNAPAFEMAGHGFWRSETTLGAIHAYLARFPGRFVGLSLGTNDQDPAAYRTHMTELVDDVLAAGKQPVVPTIPYTGEPAHLAVIPRLNAVVRELYASYGPRLLVGPDLYDVLYQGRAVMFDQPTDLHPNRRGNAAIRQAWADAMVTRLYR